MIVIHSQAKRSRSNYKLILFTSARLIAIALIIHQTCQLPSSVIAKSSRHREASQPKVDEITDKESQASGAVSSYHHPYGDSFEAIDSRLKPDLSSTLPLDTMNTAASHHHHKKGMKGWLDMGAWTKKKGAFGWYADFPVGKGK